MKTFVPSKDFFGYPDGRTQVRFRVGIESLPVSDEFVDLMFAKGLVDVTKTLRREPSQIDPPKPAVAKKIAAATKRRTGKRRQSSQD